MKNSKASKTVAWPWTRLPDWHYQYQSQWTSTWNYSPKQAPAAAIDPQPIHLEQNVLEQEHAHAIKRLETEIEVLKLKTTDIQQTMDQKMKLYVKMQVGAMSLMGMFNIFGWLI